LEERLLGNYANEFGCTWPGVERRLSAEVSMLGRYCMLLLILPYCLHIENIQGIMAGTTSTPEVIEVKSGLPVSAKHFHLLGSAIDMSLQDMWLVCGRRGGWSIQPSSGEFASDGQ